MSPAPPPPIDALRRLLEARTGRPVRVVQTHVSWLLLDGVDAWKLKKPLRLGFVDLSALAERRRCCEEELRLNRRLAPSLYLEVLPVVGTPAQPALGRAGDPSDVDRAHEFVLRMRQFPDGALFAERLAAGTLDRALVERFARRLAAFHGAAGRAPADGRCGRPEVVAEVVGNLLDALGAHGVALDGVDDWLRGELARLAPLMRERLAAGWVRDVHGDLHLANVLVLDGEPTAFDCIEFDPLLRVIDVQLDLAFFVMDFVAHGRPELGFAALDAWLAATGDHAGLALLRPFLVHRALVRALVAALRRAQGQAVDGPDYLVCARALAASADPRLAITHGLSGSGKSWLAESLLGAAGAIRLRSDVERKRLHGLDALADSRGAIYGPEANERTYARLAELAGALLDAGWPVIVDAAFLKRAERDACAALARQRRVPFVVLHCRADAATLRARVAARQAAGTDASEAGVEVLERQFGWVEPVGRDEPAIEVDTTQPVDARAIAARWKALR